MPVAPVLDVRCSFPVTPAGSSGARTWVVGHLVALRFPTGSGDDVELVVGELVSNVVLHTDARTFDVLLTVGETVTVAVQDDVPLRPVVRDFTRDGVSGRGIRIIEALAQSWGIAPTARGKAVWASIRRGPG